jgi:hypothetical protein
MRPPDKAGNAWSAWLRTSDAKKPACLRSYTVHCPGLHAAWSYWYVGLVHLRTLEGQPRAQLAYPDAEYEIVTAALCPVEGPPAIDVDHNAPPYLSPFDVSEQFHGVTDAQAIDMLDRFVDMIVAGDLAPDKDFAATWKRNIWATIEHITTGHPSGSA